MLFSAKAQRASASELTSSVGLKGRRAKVDLPLPEEPMRTTSERTGMSMKRLFLFSIFVAKGPRRQGVKLVLAIGPFFAQTALRNARETLAPWRLGALA